MKLTITTLVIVEGSYIQGIFHSLEEHPGKAYQELVDLEENEYGYDADDQKHSKNNYSDNTMKTIAYIMSTHHIGTHNLDIRDVLKSYIIARYYGWEPKEEDLEEIISNTPYFNFNVDDAIYEVLTMPREEITI